MTPTFEIVTTRLGAVSIRDNVTQEIMHNPVGPWAEANALYIEQSRLAKRLTQSLTQELVLFDVGLGAAANALATLHCARGLKNRRPLKMISFERNLELLRFALDHADQFAHFHGYEAAIESILKDGVWQEPGIQWELRHGDFTQLIEQERSPAQVVFYDPYSSKKNAEMWNVDAFTKIYNKCMKSSSEGAVLYTYSRATPVRVAMLVAGFYVGTGTATGAKDETTQAATRLQDLAHPLGPEWIKRWERSHSPNASGALSEDFPKIQQMILQHPQFSFAQN